MHNSWAEMPALRLWNCAAWLSVRRYIRATPSSVVTLPTDRHAACILLVVVDDPGNEITPRTHRWRGHRHGGPRVVRCLITGGAGFLGSHLTDRLLEAGHEVIIFDNLITGRADNVAHRFGHERFSFVKQDVTEYLYVPGTLDAVVHFASPASPIDYLRMPLDRKSVV